MDTPNPSSETLSKSLLDLVLESWRFCRVFDRLLTKLNTGELSRYQSQLRWFERKLEESLVTSGMRIVNVEGHPFDPGIAATPLNIGEFMPDDILVVDQMIEPIIMGPEGIIRMGTVTLKKSEE